MSDQSSEHGLHHSLVAYGNEHYIDLKWGLVRNSVRRGGLYTITHAETLPAVEPRLQGIIAAFKQAQN